MSGISSHNECQDGDKQKNTHGENIGGGSGYNSTRTACWRSGKGQSHWRRLVIYVWNGCGQPSMTVVRYGRAVNITVSNIRTVVWAKWSYPYARIFLFYNLYAYLFVGESLAVWYFLPYQNVACPFNSIILFFYFYYLLIKTTNRWWKDKTIQK